jgi:hypothetical protein
MLLSIRRKCWSELSLGVPGSIPARDSNAPRSSPPSTVDAPVGRNQSKASRCWIAKSSAYVIRSGE